MAILSKFEAQRQQRANDQLKQALDESFSRCAGLTEFVQRLRRVTSLNEAVFLMARRLTAEPATLEKAVQVLAGLELQCPGCGATFPVPASEIRRYVKGCTE